MADNGDSDAGTLAGIVHLLYFAQWIGVIIAIVLWATRGRQNRFLAFQSAQAVILQGAMFVVGMLFAFGYVLLMMLSFMLTMPLANSGRGPEQWPFMVGYLLAWGAIMFYWLVYLAVGVVSVWAAVRCFQGHDPWIPGVGSLAARVTGHTRTTDQFPGSSG